MEELKFWKNIVQKVIERRTHDELIYGDFFMHVAYEKNGLIKSIDFKRKKRGEQ